jgi:uncharacterized protein
VVSRRWFWMAAFSFFLLPQLRAESSRMEKLVRFERSRDVWRRRTEAIRGAILAGAQLFPLPERTALNARFANRRFRGTYSVEDVAFEAKPGFYVFGNLYRPLHPSGRVPAILVAHGHFYERGLYARARAENQILCATLAKMGAVVFTYDMVGWGDSQQVDHHAHNVLQLQLWDSIRSVDFLESLPEVDPERIGATGASGGATQIILLAAVDPRIHASMPVVMVSSRYTGTDPCEDGMKIREVPGGADTNNAEIAAVIAPRPLMVVSDGDDWTKHFPEEDFPYIRHIYELFDAADDAESVYFPKGKHNYGADSREIAYGFFSHALGLEPPAVESVHIESQSDQAVRNWIRLPVAFPVKKDAKPSGILYEAYLKSSRVSSAMWNSIARTALWVWALP